ncbi:inner membrane protein YiaA [Aureibacter tunicatorum]|nr:inner membrane protein YiaA [Aureibacter tunicatorum]
MISTGEQQPSQAFVAVSWGAMLVGIAAYLIGLWNSDMLLNEKGYYFTILLFGLFSVVSVQKNVRDKMEGIPVSNIYMGVSYAMSGISLALLVIGLWNAELLLSEKGFFGMSFVLSLFSSIAVQKNIRDMK